MSHQEWEKSPFGCRLRVIIHRLRRNSPASLDWEIERGFLLTVLDENLFELILRPRDSTKSPTTLPLLDEAPALGVDRFLIWQKAPRDEEGWEAFSSQLRARTGLTAGLILSSDVEHTKALRSYRRRRAIWHGIDTPVLQIFQNTPTASFFTVEKNLFFLGRIGRRLNRLAGLRRLLPW